MDFRLSATAASADIPAPGNARRAHKQPLHRENLTPQCVKSSESHWAWHLIKVKSTVLELVCVGAYSQAGTTTACAPALTNLTWATHESILVHIKRLKDFSIQMKRWSILEEELFLHWDFSVLTNISTSKMHVKCDGVLLEAAGEQSHFENCRNSHF